MVLPKKSVAGLAPYVAPLEGRRNLLRLDFNENTVGPSPRVLEAIRTLPPEAYSTYPEYAGLCEDFASSIGLKPEQVIAFNGADAALRALFDAFGDAGEVFLTTSPTFGYYRPCAELAGMTTNAVPYEADLSFPWDGIRQGLKDKPRICVICNPNNPTSTLVEPSLLVELARSTPDTLFAVDEIYEPFTSKSVLPEALTLPNLIAFRSMSKAAGLAALRLGFVCGASATIDFLRRVIGPYDINMFVVVAARAAIKDPEYVQDYVRQVAEAKVFTVERLQQMGIRYYSGGGNYLLVWPGKDVALVEGALRDRGILVRSMAGKPQIGGSFRLTVGTMPQMVRFLDELAAVLALPGA